MATTKYARLYAKYVQEADRVRHLENLLAELFQCAKALDPDDIPYRWSSRMQEAWHNLGDALKDREIANRKRE